MKMSYASSVLALLLSVSSLGAAAAGEKRATRNVAASSSSSSKSSEALSRPYSELSTFFSLSQEQFEATSGADATHLRAQTQGIHLGYAYLRPLRSIRWITVYGTDVGMGVLSGQSETQDEVKRQNWISFSFRPGIEYRSSVQSRVGLFLPLTYRSVTWKVDEGFEVKEKKFSVGAGLIFQQQVTSKSSFLISVAHEHQWESTTWTLAYVYKL
jgi:hypothetical protein